MSALITFAPSTTSAFQFQATLDGQQYTVVVPWGLFGARWYVEILDGNNNVVFYGARVSSTAQNPINIVEGFFSSSLNWFGQQNQFFVSP